MRLSVKKRGNSLSVHLTQEIAQIRPRFVVFLVDSYPSAALEEGRAKSHLLFARKIRVRAKVLKSNSCKNDALPTDMSAKVVNKNSLLASKTASEQEKSACDSNFVKKIEAARRGMKKYRNALAELAK